MDVVVAIPAHDEAATIGPCLDSVLAAVSEARRARMIGRARIAVAAHRCTDDTYDLAITRLDGVSAVESLVREVSEDVPVGAVRTRLVRAAVAEPPALPAGCWILSTDADTVVPTDWVTGLLAAARESAADVVLGLADLDHWAVDEASRHAYRMIIDAGIRGDQHEHAYAANLAVSWSAFAAVGGFPAVPHGEEHALVRVARAQGRRVVSPVQPRVVTSARMPGRAAAGLGELLGRLAADNGAVHREKAGEKAAATSRQDGVSAARGAPAGR